MRSPKQLERSVVNTRGVSPVVGAVLLIGGTLVLAVVVAPFIFSTANSAGDEMPDADFSFSYSETVSLSKEDSYGKTGKALNADGLLTITVQRGDQLDAKQVTIKGAASGGALTGAGYSKGDKVKPGQSFTVWVNRGATVEVVWNTEGKEKSTIIRDYEVFPLSTGPAGVPKADYNCNGWSFPSDFDSKPGITAGSGDLLIDGVVLKCDLSKYNIDNIKIKNDGANVGNVEANANINILDGATYAGYVSAGNDLDLDPAEIHAEYVDVGNKIHAYSGTESLIEVDTNVTAGNGIDLDDGDTIQGNVVSKDDVNLRQQSTINGNLNVQANDVVIKQSSRVAGRITGSGNVNLKSAARVDGKIDVTGNIGLDGASTVGADVYPGGSLQCNDGDSSTITGTGCLEYRDPHFDMTITSTNSPVIEGNTLDVTVKIKNTGLQSGSQTLELLIDGSQESTLPVSVSGRSQKTKTISWATTTSDKGTHNATVSAVFGEHTPDETTVEVKAAGSLSPVFKSLNITLNDIKSFKNKNDEINKVTFGYNLRYANSTTTTTFKLVGRPTTATPKTGTNGTATLSKLQEPLPATFKADITGGECYKIQITSGATQGDTYDILLQGTTC